MPDAPEDWYDERLLCADARDAAEEAETALWGVIHLLDEREQAVEPRGITAVLRLIHDRLHPAVRTLEHYKAPE